MEKKTTFKGIDVYYRDEGKASAGTSPESRGVCILLLHGYLESREIWEGFTPYLTGQYRVICMDLPGHGKSGVWGKEHSMDNLAGSVRAVMEAEGIRRIFLAGHSMGGYVTMAFADLYPDLLLGYILFHSTPFADTEEKKANRDREISLVLCKKKRQIVNVNIPKAFADDNVERLGEQVALARHIALNNEDRGIMALLNGMKARPDRTRVLRDASLPLLLVGGMKDNYIPAEVFEKLVGLAPHASSARLEHSGHMGFMEEPGSSARAIREFLQKNRPGPE